jgi:WD40 repeat protein
VDNTIKIWDAESGQELQTLTGRPNGVLSVAYSPDGHRIASGSGDGTVWIWDAESGQELQTLMGYGWLWSVAYSPDGHRIASGSEDGTVRIWGME